MPERLLDEELARAANGAGVPIQSLEGLFRGESAGQAPAPWNETEIVKSLGRLLVVAAEELEAVAAREGDEESGRGGLLGLAVVAGLLEVPKLATWSILLAESNELTSLAADAARMLRGEAFETAFSQNLLELRECEWRWPERRLETFVEPEQALPEPEPPAAAEVAESEPEPEAPAFVAHEVEPEPEPVLEPAAVRVPPPPAPRRAAAPRALVADPSAIAAGFLARLLMSRGIAVTMAETAERAAAEVARGEHELAFVDAEWALPANVHGTLIVRLFAEGANPRVGPGERFLHRPPADEELSRILASWSGRPAPHGE